MSNVVGIHQPNFFPWTGYFNKIYKSDVFVIIDEVQFAKGSVCNRCKIKDNMGREIWFTVPVRPENGTASTFNQIKIADPVWYNKGLNALRAAYNNAPYFKTYYPVIESLLKKEYESLAEMNIAIIAYFCDFLKISTPVYVQSKIGKEFGKKNELNLGITRHFDGATYLSGQGAKKYNDHELFEKNGVTIQYLEFPVPTYPQVNGPFVEKLSIIDLLFNEGENAVNYVCV